MYKSARPLKVAVTPSNDALSSRNSGRKTFEFIHSIAIGDYYGVLKQLIAVMKTKTKKYSLFADVPPSIV